MKHLFTTIAIVALSFVSCNQNNKSTETLRVMSYNVRNCKGLDLKLDYDRCADVINRAQPDIVAVQELDSMTSRYEGLPMTLLEAKTYKLPIVSFDIDTGPDEIINDKINGFLIPPYDCNNMVERINELIENEELRQQFEEASVNEIDKFRLGNVIPKWIELISKL